MNQFFFTAILYFVGVLVILGFCLGYSAYRFGIRPACDLPKADPHIARHVKQISRLVKMARQAISYEDPEDWFGKSYFVTFGIHVSIEVQPTRERFFIVCDERFGRFAQDLKKALRQIRALEFQVVEMAEEEYLAPS